jgi:hypothetical protein
MIPNKIYEQVTISSGNKTWSGTAEIDTGSDWSYICQYIISQLELETNGEYFPSIGGALQMEPSYDVKYTVDIESTVSDKESFTVIGVPRGQSVGDALFGMDWLSESSDCRYCLV